MAVIEMFHPNLLQLQEEIGKNPALQKIMCALPADADLSDKLCEVCAFCGIVMDGFYDEEQVHHIAGVLARELRAVREEKELIVVGSFTTPTPTAGDTK